MKKNKVGLAALVGVGAFALYTVATLPPAPPAVPPVPSVIPVPNVPELTAYDMPTGHVPVSNEPYQSTYRSVSLSDLADRNLTTGVYTGTPYWKQREQWFKDHYYDTLAARKVWAPGTSPETHKRGDKVTWKSEPIPQYVPPPCDQLPLCKSIIYRCRSDRSSESARNA
jgi:hypothetical protein